MVTGSAAMPEWLLWA